MAAARRDQQLVCPGRLEVFEELDIEPRLALVYREPVSHRARRDQQLQPHHGGLFDGKDRRHHPPDWRTQQPILQGFSAAHRLGLASARQIGIPRRGLGEHHLHPGYAMNWNATVEYQISANNLVKATYQGSAGVHLVETWNINAFPHTLGENDPALRAAAYAAPQNYLPYPQFGSINNMSNTGHS